MTYLELARQLGEINKEMLKISEYREIMEVNRGEGVVLSYLVHHNDEATPVQLSQALEVSTARIAALLNKMERKKLVVRQRHPDNNRNTIVKLLPDGKKLHEKQESVFNQCTVRFFESLGEEKAALFVELQREMVDFLLKNQMGGTGHE